MLGHIYNPCIWEAEGAGSQVQGQLGLQQVSDQLRLYETLSQNQKKKKIRGDKI